MLARALIFNTVVLALISSRVGSVDSSTAQSGASHPWYMLDRAVLSCQSIYKCFLASLRGGHLVLQGCQPTLRGPAGALPCD